jgi:formylglycine-generating enzyme required for sulfatase activity
MLVFLYHRHGTGAFEGNRSQLFGRFVGDAIERDDERYRDKHNGASHPGRDGIKEALGRLAWAMQNQAQGPDKVRLAMDANEAGTMISADQQVLAQGAGLIEWRTTVRFTHQLLQEYFAALGMRTEIRAGRLSAEWLWPRAHWWDRSGWEEAAVFLAGLDPEDPSLVIDWLKDAQPEVLVQCLKESGCAAPSAEQLDDLKARWLPRLAPKRELAPEGRHSVALALGRLGLDDRPGVVLRADGLPDIDWVEVPAGPFLYGEGKEKRDLDTFWIARYPVTNAQYQAFIDDRGYEDDRWWVGLPKHSTRPWDPIWSGANRPRDTVIWYEAEAYTRWLSARLGLEVTLPTELQWEKAARGEDGREYPWGEGYRAGFANVDESQLEGGHYLEQTTAVGLYPQGASPYGVLDLSGNVWEWCLNKLGFPEETDLAGKHARVLRGGSWTYDPDYARAAFRFRAFSDHRYHPLSFRVLCGSPMVTED